MRFFILFGLAALAACGSDHKNPSEDSTTTSSGNEEPTSPASEAQPPSKVEPPVPINVTMPDFAPQYPGSTIKAVNKSHSGEEIHEVTLATQDDAVKIVDFYREKFTAAGLQKTSEFLSGGTGMMSAAGQGKKASIAITNKDGYNAIVVTFSGK